MDGLGNNINPSFFVVGSEIGDDTGARCQCTSDLDVERGLHVVTRVLIWGVSRRCVSKLKVGDNAGLLFKESDQFRRTGVAPKRQEGNKFARSCEVQWQAVTTGS